MRNDKHIAIKLRKLGKNYSEISKETDIPKSTLSDWFSNLIWSKAIKKDLSEKANRLSTKRMKAIAAANKKRWGAWRRQHRQEAKKNFPDLESDPLFIVGIMLYWGEGDSDLKNEVRLANVDPRMIKLFNKFLQKTCGIPREDIGLALTLYPDLSDIRCKKFWSHRTGISLTRFSKSQFIYGRHPTKKLENGVCTIRVGASGGLKEKIFTWIELFSQKHKTMRE